MSGTVQNDILKEYIARGTYIYPLAPALRIVTDIFAFCRDRAPEWNTISISGYHIREAGSTAVQEVAFTLANAIAYVEAALARGLAVDEFAPRLSFFLNAHNDLLEEIGKFRAARRLWARIMRERFQAQDPRSWMFRFHTQTAGSTLTAQQPNVNIVRVTLQALAAVLGGTQSLHTNARDEALALPTEASALLALRTQQILAAESGVANTIDPLAGSYVIEKLTDEDRGPGPGIPAQDRCHGRHGARHRIGLRAARDPAGGLRIPESHRAGRPGGGGREPVSRQAAALACPSCASIPKSSAPRWSACASLRARRDAARVEATLPNARKPRAPSNLMPAILDAVKPTPPWGKSPTLRRVFGEYQESVVI